MTLCSRRLHARRLPLYVEELEDRQLLTGFQPSAAAQLFLEELNAARANPAAYGAAIGVDLSAVPPSQPLAFNPLLVEAAQLHSEDMNARGYFSHDTPEGSDPGQRMAAAGFAWSSWGESIAGGTAYPNPSDALQALIVDAGVPDLGHRDQLLAIDAIFQDQNQVGIGVVQGGSGPLSNYYTIDTAAALSYQPILTGVVFNDVNESGQYAIGEGLGGVTISVAGVGAVQTWASGGYSIPLNPGTYVVTASGGGLPEPMTCVVTVGLQNVQLNFTPQQDTYIRQLYQTIVARAPTVGELTYSLTVLQSPAGAVGLVEQMEHSEEARTRLVDSWYQTYLGRLPVNGEQMVYVNLMLQGATEEQALAAFLGSNVFLNHVRAEAPAGAAPAFYIAELYALLLHRPASQVEVGIWSSNPYLANLEATNPSAVVMYFLDSLEYRQDVVESYYMDLLHRTTTPSLVEIDASAASALDLCDIRVYVECSQEFRLQG